MRRKFKYFTQKYIDWVIKLGRFKFSLLGILVLAVLAVFVQILFSIFIVGQIHWNDLIRSVSFGLISAPFVIYFFTLLVEKLELSRLNLAKSVEDLQQEIKERALAEQRLAQINRDKTVLMETISHELRTPLNGIIGLSRIVLEGDLSAEQRNYLKTINVSAISLGHILADIIDFEKIDGMRIELNPIETDFSLLLSNIANIGTLMAEQKQLRFEIKCGQNLPNFLMLDYTRLSQILWNLLSNAVKFTDKGKITLEVNRLNAKTVSFVLSDTGHGIPPSEIDKIFAMYYQVRKNKTAGSGIGLAISKSIAGLMGGDLTVQSELGKGSSFTLTIHAQEVENPGEMLMKPASLNLNILLVEDIELNVIVARAVLEKLGYSVDVAMTGQQAIEKFEQNYYDLIFLDIQLPDMTGFQIARYLRQRYESGEYDYLPLLIALTANVMHSKEEYRQQGMDDVLSKPLSVKALNRCLTTYFGKEQALTETQPQDSVQSAVDFQADFAMLNELIAMLGVQPVKDNLKLFRQLMPEYVAELQSELQAYLRGTVTKSEVAGIAHKIKGAAASVGLKYIRQIAQHAQQHELPDWEKHIIEWVALLERHWTAETDKLMSWLTEKGEHKS